MPIAALVIPLPEDRRGADLLWARESATILSELGCFEVKEACVDGVPTNSRTDFCTAVAAEPGE